MQYSQPDIENVIRIINTYAHKAYQYESVKNVEAVKRALNAAEDFEQLKTFILRSVKEKKPYADDLVKLLDTFVAIQPFYDDVLKSAEPRELTKDEKQLAAAVAALGNIVSETVAKTDMDGVQRAVTENIKSELTKFIYDTYGPITKQVNVVSNGKTIKIKGVLHEKFDEVLAFVMKNEPVFLTGPAGTGKSHMCKQIAQCLELPFYMSNAVTQEYKILGFTDANGVYQETQFYKAFKNGGLFMLDEMDASIPEVLNILNTAIANRYQDFPAPIGFVEAHPNFRVVAAGNTFGIGADAQYVGRYQLDAATNNRFGFVEINYDPTIEEALAGGDNDLLGFCRAFRRAIDTAGIHHIVSYREISRMANLKGLLKPADLVKSCIVKALSKADLDMIRNNVQGYGVYTEGFNALL